MLRRLGDHLLPPPLAVLLEGEPRAGAELRDLLRRLGDHLLPPPLAVLLEGEPRAGAELRDLLLLCRGRPCRDRLLDRRRRPPPDADDERLEAEEGGMIDVEEQELWVVLLYSFVVLYDD